MHKTHGEAETSGRQSVIKIDWSLELGKDTGPLAVHSHAGTLCDMPSKYCVPWVERWVLWFATPNHDELIMIIIY